MEYYIAKKERVINKHNLDEPLSIMLSEKKANPIGYMLYDSIV